MTEPNLDPTPEDAALAASLAAQRPAPTPSFRTTLGRRLAALDPGYGHRPDHLRARTGALLAAGGMLMLVGLLVSTGGL